MPKKPRVAVVGSLVFDFVASAPSLPRPGETILGTEFGIYPGGKGANQAVQAARLGAEVHLIGRVGHDSFGDQLLASLQTDGVNTEFVTRDPQAGTAACCIHVDQQGRNAIVIVPQANAALRPEHIETARHVIEAADILLAQLETPLATIDHAFQMARAAGVATILNPAPAQPLPSGLLGRTTYLTPNEVEMEMLSGVVQQQNPANWERRSATKLMDMGAVHVIITLAERGCYVGGKTGEFFVPSFPVQAIDTTAAGDAFNGALGVALSEKMGLELACGFANAAGALATTVRGAQPSMPNRSQVEALLKGRTS
jgi:ribokinase